MTTETDSLFMKRCEALAAIAAERGESPVGSVVVLGGKIIGEGIEAGKSKQDVTFHAEVEAVRDAVRKHGKDLSTATLYTTHEPCILCSYVIRHHRNGDNSISFASLSGLDTSPFNLSSIVCLVEFQDKKILFTGDARSDDVLNGLQSANLLNQHGKIHVDILKIPHHGSDRNSSQYFFEQVTADHYVISGDGSHENPDKATLVMLAEATAGRNDFTIHFTYHDGEHGLRRKLDEFIEDERSHGRSFAVNFRGEDSNSIILNLLEGLNY